MNASGIRRVPPLAIAIVLVALALVATAWSTRSTTIDAYSAVRDGHALAVQQTVRADLADLGGPPTSEDLDSIVREHAAEGLRYLAFLDGRGRVHVASGTQTIERPAQLGNTGMRIDHVGDRVRIEVRSQLRRAWGSGRGSIWMAMEIESPQAASLRGAATRTLAIGLLAALVLLAVAAWLVRTELRRNALERQRERERRLASLGEMSAVLAHEIRNPLASLKGNAQLLASSLSDGEKSHARARRVVDEAIRLEKLTQDLLAFVRTGELARADAVPAEIAKSAIGDRAVTLDVANAPATWSLDAARMQEVLVNLIDNAVAASLPGEAAGTSGDAAVAASLPGDAAGTSGDAAAASGAAAAASGAAAAASGAAAAQSGEAAAPSGARPVELRVAEWAGRLVIEVRDHGPGVPAAARDKIFEPFFTGKTRGTGLGLAIARRIVELHRGTITVDDAPGGGALFRIEIPR